MAGFSTGAHHFEGKMSSNNYLPVRQVCTIIMCWCPHCFRLLPLDFSPNHPLLSFRFPRQIKYIKLLKDDLKKSK